MTTIFITIPWFLPAFRAGGPIQSVANMVRELDIGYRFYIYTSNKDLNGSPIPVTAVDQWITFNSYTSVWYSRKEGRSQHLVEEIERINPDVLYMIGMYSWHFTIVPLFFAKAKDKLISPRGMLHPGALTQKAQKKKVYLALLKAAGVVKRARFQATDELESFHISTHFGTEATISIAGNFPRLLQPQSRIKGSNITRFVSVGLISPMKGYKEVLEAFTGLQEVVEYNIYGPVKDTAYWDQCLAVIKNLPPNIKVFYHQELSPDKLEAALSHQHIFILPSKSENFGHAIFEALSAGLPVITSDATPWNGLGEAKAGLNVIPGYDGLLHAIQFFAKMQDPEYQAYVAGAERYARFHFDKAGLQQAYRELFSPAKNSMV